MDIFTGLDHSKKPQKSDAELEFDTDCMELLKLARIHKQRGEKEESEQFYAVLVQVLRPEHAAAELQI